MVSVLDKPVLRFHRPEHKIVGDLLAQIYREVRHIREVEIQALPTVLDNQTNMDLRISFLLKEMVSFFRFKKSSLISFILT